MALMRNGSVVKLFPLNIEKFICMKRKHLFTLIRDTKILMICNRSVELEEFNLVRRNQKLSSV